MTTLTDLPEVNHQKSLDRISSLMAWFVQKIKHDNAMGLFDKNRLCEDILIPILSEIYGYNNLNNLNKDTRTFPGIDLGDDVAKVAFQITSDANSSKIKDTLQKFIKYKHYEKYDQLIVYIITEKQKSYSGKAWSKTIGGKFKFEKEDIKDSFDLLKTISQIPSLKKIQSVERLLEEYFTKTEKTLKSDQLKAIANQSLDYHRVRFAFNQTSETVCEVSRDIHPNIVERLKHSPKPLIGITGPSGTGKSTLLRQIGHDINNKQGFALWIPAENIVPTISINELVLNTLRHYIPDLSNHTIPQTLELVSQTDIGLALLIDDINRVPNPDETLAVLNALSANIYSNNLPIHFVVPLWPGQIASKPDEQTAQKHWEIINLGYFSAGERKNYSELVSSSRIPEMKQLINSLNGDPFLIGLATEDATTSNETIELLHQIFNRAIDKSIKDARTKSGQKATPKEFDAAIDSLIELILYKGTPEPTWESIRESVGNPKSDLLYDLAKINQLGWIDTLQNGNEIWHWKHTRLRDVLIGRWLARNLLQPFNSNHNPHNAGTFFDDPGLAEAFALAFVFLPASTHRDTLKVVCKHQPLSLVEILRLNLFSHETELNTTVTQTIQRATLGINQHLRVFVASPEHVVLQHLAEITNPAVLDATDGLQGGWTSGIARLRNGDLQAGMYALAKEAESSEILTVNFPFLEQAVADFGQVRCNQKQETALELSRELLNPKHTNAVLYVASLLKWPELIEPLWNYWINSKQEIKIKSLATMAWFLSGYDYPSITSKLETALLMSLEISDIPKSENMGSERYHDFVDMLRLALARHNISDTAVKVWVKVIPENEELCKSMAYLLGCIDHPAALDAFLRYGRVGFWGWTSESIDPMVNDRHMRENPVENQETRNHLWNLVLQENDLSLRRAALSFWSNAAKSSDLPKLQTISAEDALFDNVLKLRLRLRDKEATSFLIERIQKDPREWCRFTPLLPHEPGIFETLLNSLESIRAEHGFHFHAKSIFHRLPPEQIAQIVLKKENLLIASPETWGALWISGEDTALNFVVKAIRDTQGNAKVESHLKHFFSIGRRGSHDISLKMLNVLLPILDCFPQEELKWLADLALLHGFGKWAIENLDDVLRNTSWRNFEWVYMEKVIATLSSAAQYVKEGLDSVHKKSDLFGLEISYRDREKYGYMANIVEAVKVWLRNNPDPDNLVIAARIMSEFGFGNDIDWWLTQKPADKKLFLIWNNALFHLRRRRWQSA